MNMNTVKLNVGGVHFELSHEAVTHPVIMASKLGKMVCESLREDPNKAVYIDRSADLLALVLEYLHYGRYVALPVFVLACVSYFVITEAHLLDVFNSNSVQLPSNILRPMFEVELGFYELATDQVWDHVFWRLDEDCSNDVEDEVMMDD